MPDELDELYQQTILDHYRQPRNVGELPDADGRAEGHNPLCGDHVVVFVVVRDGVVHDVRFRGSGCAISTASASLMTETIKGRTLDEARALFRSFHALVTGQTRGPGREALGKLEVFGNVRNFPARVKCATLPWHTLEAALERRTDAVVTTE